ncbi:MAG: acetyl-CoA carboxylase biotin carboxyl carrier protein [Lewinella sp.]|nr:acetyl-CoA carboxylase biotin carboxyl carrier protein [Lewinella sp.]
MTNKEVQDLVKLLSKLEIAEFKIKDGEFQLSVRTKHYKVSTEGSATQGPAAQSAVMPVAPISQPFVSQVPPQAPAPAAAPAAASAPAHVDAQAGKSEDGGDESRYVPVKSPMVGTFYRSPSPDKPPYVKVGDTVAKGDIVCIIEAMKLFNEIESEVTGKIVKVMVEDAQPVEYDQVLYLVDPS